MKCADVLESIAEKLVVDEAISKSQADTIKNLLTSGEVSAAQRQLMKGIEALPQSAGKKAAGYYQTMAHIDWKAAA